MVDDWTGETLASQAIDGRRRARDHATKVAQRLAAGMKPDVAVVAR